MDFNTFTDYGRMQCFFFNNLNTFCKEFYTCTIPLQRNCLFWLKFCIM